MDPSDRFVVLNGFGNKNAWIIPLDGSPPRSFEGVQGQLGGVSIDSSGHRLAIGGAYAKNVGMPDEPVITVRNIETGDTTVLRSEGQTGFIYSWFLPGDRLVAGGHEGLVLWDIRTGSHEVLSRRSHKGGAGDLDAAGRHLLIDPPAGVTLWDLEQRSERILPIDTEGTRSLAIAPDASFVVAGREDGTILFLPRDSDRPRVLLGHEAPVSAIRVPPSGDRIVSAARDGTVRVWPIPKGPPVHDLPHGEFLTMLRGQTNVRAIVDPKTEEGYRIEFDAFPGWKETPRTR